MSDEAAIPVRIRRRELLERLQLSANLLEDKLDQGGVLFAYMSLQDAAAEIKRLREHECIGDFDACSCAYHGEQDSLPIEEKKQ